MKKYMYKLSSLTLAVVLFSLAFSACQPQPQAATSPTPTQESGSSTQVQTEAKKILYIDSYDATYGPSVQNQDGFKSVIEVSDIPVDWQVFYMDQKNKGSDEEQQAAALEAKRLIESWKPDLLVATDDPASKYLVMPYYKDASIPVVFNGINWDAGQYGYPYSNATGQVEVELVNELLDQLGNYAAGPRVGFLTGDTTTDHQSLEYYQNDLHIDFTKVAFVDNFADWKTQYLAMQDEVDILFFRSNGGIEGWDDDQAIVYINANTHIPTGTIQTHMARMVLISYAKVTYEFGQYAARTALEILGGKSPSDFPITTNRQAKVYLDMTLAKSLNIKFPMDLVSQATLVQ